MLEAHGDPEGLADAWLLISKLRFWSGRDSVQTDQAIDRAARLARRSANHRAERESTLMLMYQLVVRPTVADEAVSKGESLLQTAAGDSWAEAAILGPLSVLYSYISFSPMPGWPLRGAGPYSPGLERESTGPGVRSRAA